MGKFIAGSNSRLELYESCPHFFKLQNLDKVPAEKSPALLLGIAAHEFFASYVKHCVDSGQSSDLAWVEENGPRFVSQAPGEMQPDAEQIIDRFCRSYAVSPAGNLGTELEAAFSKTWEPTEWRDWDRTYMRFKMDRVYMEGEGEDRRIVVEDFKTDRQIDARQKVETSPQLRRYAFAASLLWPDEARRGITVRLQYARYGVVREAIVEPEQFPAIRSEIERKMEKLNSERDWAPTPGPHCGYCPYTARCPLAKAAWGDTALRIDSADDAASAAERMQFMRSLLKTYEDRLRAYVTGNGDVQMRDGSKLGFVSVKKIAFPDVKQVVDSLLESGVERDITWAALSVSKAGIEKALRSLGRGKLQEHWPAIEKLGADATETHFKVHKGEEE